MAWLRTPEAVRERCNAMLALCEGDALAHFVVEAKRMDAAADYVAAVIRSNYPNFGIPYHSRWRHFETGGIDRWGRLAAGLRDCDRAEIARRRVDLCVVSVLLDAGAGPAWRFREPETGQILARSEGLAVASLHAFCAGLFAGDPACPLRADADGLSRVSEASLAAAFQVTPDNPLAGLAGRVGLLRNLAAVLRRRPDEFGAAARVGGLFDHWRARASNGALPARVLLGTLLEALAPIWPGRLTLGGQNIGDVWYHPTLISPLPLAGEVAAHSVAGEGAHGLVPFHKLSQWLSYSLVEVLEHAGVAVGDLDALTGLAEYRNGGLLLDLGVLRLRDPSLASAPLAVDHAAVIEWRALTVALLDRLAPMLRTRLGRSAAELPLARLLEGGTWAAGRKIARERRAGGGPPLQVVSDGTVF
ncbi:MAG TPA: DUF1688 family protein [Acetobacteraceae bacterium]|nr:DUF1688 family protein [Acetobacteraceae bacterium]